MTDDIGDRAHKMQESVNALGAGKPKDSLGSAMGAIMVRALEDAYRNGRADARIEIERQINALPVRTRAGVELIERGITLRLIHELDSYDDGTQS